jgi:ABC-2 type transport system ATP-binding protein
MDNASNPSVIECRGLTKVFKDFWLRPRVTAVDGLDLAVQPREVFGLLGPNGSGKSTTIKLLLGLLFPTRGVISIFGRHPTDTLIKSRIGYLPEESYLYRFLDARETLDFYGRLFQLERRERRRRTEMLLDMVGLEAVQRRPVGEYSKGMQRRIGLAQALINDPDLLILDEPTTGLDPLGTRQVKDLILMLRERGKTVLLTTHYMDEAERLCDYVVIMSQGSAVCQGSPKQLIAERVGKDAFEVDCTAAEEHQLLDGFGSLGKLRSGARLLVYGADVSPLVQRLQHLDPLRPFVMRPANLEDVFLAQTGTRLEAGA